MTPRSLRLQGQAIAEYAIVLGVVVMAFTGMSLYAKRGIAAGIKMAADRIGPDAPPEEPLPEGEWAQQRGMAFEANQVQDEPLNPNADMDVDPGTFLGKWAASKVEVDQRVNTQTGAGGSVQRTVIADRTKTTGALGDPGTAWEGVSYISIVVARDAQD